MPDDDLSAALAWLHERLEHSFTIDMGTVSVDGAMIRGRDPLDALNLTDVRDRYDLTVYVPAFTVRLDPDDLDTEHDDEELRLRTSFGRLDITDDGARQ
jgi:hypothetical protein